MNTVAKTAGCALVDRHAGDATPGDKAGSPGWAEAVLRQVGLPVSRQRRLVLDALRGRDRPVTAQDLHWELKLRNRQPSAAGSAPGLTTVYRILAVQPPTSTTPPQTRDSHRDPTRPPTAPQARPDHLRLGPRRSCQRP